MLTSTAITRRQSEVRQRLAELAGETAPTDEQRNELESLEREYGVNETRYRAALIAEDDERRDAGEELETREGREFDDLVAKFELRQVAAFYDEQRALDGETAEVVSEMRSQGAYQGVPVPFAVLEQRADTVASGTPDPLTTAPTIDRLFPQSVASRMGCRLINIPAGEREYPVVTSSIAAGWIATEGGTTATPTAFATTDRGPLAPTNNLGVTVTVTRNALKQSGAGLEQAIRRDMGNAMEQALDAAFINGSGSDGQPTGVLNIAGINATAVNDKASYAIFQAAIRRLMDANAITSPGSVRILAKPLTWSILDDTLITGTSDTEWDRLTRRIGANNVVITTNALPAAAAEDATDKGAHTCLLAVTTGGVPPAFCATWGGVDVIRDPYSGATSGKLSLTALVTADVAIARPAQLEILTGVQDRAN